jgi:hypothetical protein
MHIKMRVRMLEVAGWATFAFIVAYAGNLALAACDIGVGPFFGLKYCMAPAAPDHLADQRGRERDLRTRIHQAELRIAQLPSCAPPRPPKTQAQIDTPPPQPKPQPSVDPPREELKIPKNLAELKGCWQSVRGDIEIVTSDAEKRPIGSVRVCYCFSESGRGAVQAVYSDGAKCRAPLRARLSADRLVMNHPLLRCSVSDHDIDPGEIDCKGTAEGDSATCDWRSKGPYPDSSDNDKYQRVSPEQCN